MKCLVFKILYRMVPFNYFKVKMIDGHFAQCPRCGQREIGRDLLKQVITVGTDVGDDFDLWPRVKATIVGGTAAPRHFSSWRLAMAGAAGVVVVLMLLLPFHKPRLDEPAWPGKTARESDRIIIKSVSVDDRPAKTFYFKSQDKDRLIVWVQ